MNPQPRRAIAAAIGRLARRAGRGGGTSLPGKVLLRLEPDAIAAMAAGLQRGSVVISATNGKTTTAAMVAEILERDGARLVHNRAGANMAGGVASALLDADRDDAQPVTDTGLFEVDEFWLDAVVAELEPGAILLANLFRDQLDRYGELEAIADRWAAVTASLGEECALVLNADDPLVADLGRDRDNVVYFGLEDDSLALDRLSHASDSKHCRRCGHPYTYDAVYLAHLGHYHCPNCSQGRPMPQISARGVALDGLRGSCFELHHEGASALVELPLPGLYNVYNALAAAALGRALGIGLDEITRALATVAPAFGRAEAVDVDGTSVTILLIKNPAGANEVLRTLTLAGAELDLLCVLNDRTADGRDVSWVWDADFEELAPNVRHVTCAGTRAAELGLRLRYAGVPGDRINVIPALARAFDDAVQRSGPQGALYALPTYTALLELRDLLARRGHSDPFWL